MRKWNVLQRMDAKGVRHLPVTNEMGEIIGMLSDRDVQRSMISQLEKPSGRIVSDETIKFDEESRVRDYMSWPAKSVSQNSELRHVAEIMVVDKVSSLVCKGDEPVGIVSTEDLIKVLIEMLSDPKTSSRWTLEDVLKGAFTQLSNTLV